MIDEDWRALPKEESASPQVLLLSDQKYPYHKKLSTGNGAVSFLFQHAIFFEFVA